MDRLLRCLNKYPPQHLGESAVRLLVEVTTLEKFLEDIHLPPPNTLQLFSHHIRAWIRRS